MTNLLSPFFLVSSVVTLSLGFWVVSLNPKNKIYFSWLLFCLSVGLWSFGLGVLTSLHDERIATWFYFVHYFGAINIPIAFLYFIRVYFLKDPKLRPDLLMGIIFAILQMWLFAIGELCAPLTPKWKFFFYTNPGHFYVLFMAYFFLYVLYTFFLMLKSTIFDEPENRKRKIFFIIATGLGYIGGSSAFLLVYNINFPPYGIYLFLLFPIITTYAIIKLRFMDIEVFIKRTLVFAGIVTVAVSLVALPFALIQAVIGRALGIPNPFILAVLAIITTVLIYRPVERIFTNITDKYLFQKKVDYKKLLKEASQEMAFIKSLQQLARLVVAFLIKKGRISRAAVYIRSNEDADFDLRASRPALKDSGYGIIKSDHQLLCYLQIEKKPIEFHELEHQMKEGKNEIIKQIKPIFDIMKLLKIEVIIPSFLGRKNSTNKDELKLQSLLFLGAKKSDEPYSQEDLDVFYTLAQESAIAVENARLYDAEVKRRLEIEEAHRKLQEMELQLIETERRNLLAKMTGGVAHEVRNPLSYTQNAAYFMKKYVAELDSLSNVEEIPEEQRKKLSKIAASFPKYIESIVVATGRIKSVVQTIEAFAKRKELDVTKLSKTDFNIDSINIEMLLTLVLEEIRFKYQSINQPLANIETQLEKNLPSLAGDQNALVQVFFNLISNAQDAMKKSAQKKITIKARIDSDDHESVHLEFQDSGSGIPEELKDKVWDYLFTTKKNEGGSGIGLLWCKTIVEEVHTGKIWFESTEGIGTTFHLKIPVWKYSLPKEIA